MLFFFSLISATRSGFNLGYSKLIANDKEGLVFWIALDVTRTVRTCHGLLVQESGLEPHVSSSQNSLYLNITIGYDTSILCTQIDGRATVVELGKNPESVFYQALAGTQ